MLTFANEQQRQPLYIFAIENGSRPCSVPSQGGPLRAPRDVTCNGSIALYNNIVSSLMMVFPTCSDQLARERFLENLTDSISNHNLLNSEITSTTAL
jgi:hypothetical protein